MISNEKSILRATLGRWIVRIVLILATAIFIYPIIWNFLASIKSNTEFMTNPFSLPTAFHYENYIRAFTKAKMADYFVNSIFIVAFSTAILVVFVIPFSYVITRYHFFGSKFLMSMYMACIFIQATYIMVPLFLQVNALGWQDSRVALGIIYAVLQFPFAIFVLSGDRKSVV